MHEPNSGLPVLIRLLSQVALRAALKLDLAVIPVPAASTALRQAAALFCADHHAVLDLTFATPAGN